MTLVSYVRMLRPFTSTVNAPEHLARRAVPFVGSEPGRPIDDSTLSPQH